MHYSEKTLVNMLIIDIEKNNKNSKILEQMKIHFSKVKREDFIRNLSN